jgi:hypothetical protein
MRRNPVRHLAWILLPFSFLLFLLFPPPDGALWTALLIAPVFLIAATLTVPAFSAFELSLPVTRSQLYWARILMCLTLVWLPLLIGLPAMRLRDLHLLQSVTDARPPLEFASFFTASACLATAARISPRRSIGRICWLLASLCGLLTLRSLPLAPAVVLAALALGPIVAKLWWTYLPEWHWSRQTSFRGELWPPLRFIWRW